MSGNESESDSDSGQGGAGRREVAWRVFAAEYDDADFDYSESDEERAPNYVVTPTGARVNRLFVVGVLTEVEQVSDEVLRGRVVDPTGAFVLYAGQYQPDEMAFLEAADPPMFVAVTGKARTFQPDDSDRVFTSIRPESINEVDAGTRDRWVVQTAEQTLDRVSTVADALDAGRRGDDLRQALESAGVDAGLAAGVPLALDHYGTTKGYLAGVRGLALDAARVVAGEIGADEVGPLDLAPDEGGDAVDASLDYSLSGDEEGDIGRLETEAEPGESTTEADPTADDEVTADDESTAGDESTAEAESTTGVGSADEVEADAEPESTTSDDLGEAPTTTVDESASESESEAESDASAEEAVAGSEAESEPATDEEAPAAEDADDAAELQDEIGTEEPPEVESEQDTTDEEEFASEADGDDEGPDLDTAGAGDEMYEFDDEEREQIEEEHGLEFSSGSEVDSPEESDLDAPDPEVGAEPEGEPGDTDQHAEPTSEAVDTDQLQDVDAAQGGTEAAVNDAEEAPAGGETAAAEAPGTSIGEDEVAERESESAEEEESSEHAQADSSGDAETPDDLEDAVMDRMQELDEGDGVEREKLLAALVQDYDVTPADVDDALESALMAGRCYESGEDTLKPI
ncbi:hypothetical protein [Halorussus litoreus]|uniref:hypothetical protein n=1 Tax=Halorussus litoreus TaxID=1710536 RepID=UPI000E25E6A8|nr:hypothetical protein [Halorussus litoreus]